MPQGRMSGPGPAPTPPTGRATGPGVIGADPSKPQRRVFSVGGVRYDAPMDVTDEQIAEALGAPIDLPEFGGGATPASPEFRELMGAIPSAVYGGMGMASALKEPALQLGKRLLMRAAPDLKPIQAVGALQRGAGALRASNLTKLPPATREAMQNAIAKAGPTIQPSDLGWRGGVGYVLGGPWGAAALAGAKIMTRPKPLSHIAQGIASSGAAAGPVVGGVGGGLAQLTLQRLLGGGQ